ncbi:MAG: hypothetical protein MUC67_12195, partial [Acidobacteria bacterium]|nr:hypothetical protein [Acidobacteriota bacterium]
AAVVLFVFWSRAPQGWTKRFLAIAWISAVAFPVCAVLHNAVDAVFHLDEPFFFLLAVIAAPLGLAVGLVGAALTVLLARRSVS